jgi:hypothetical protein
MFNFTNKIKVLILAASLTSLIVLTDAYSELSPKPYSAKPQLQAPVPKKEEVPKYKPKRPIRPELPPMGKPFGMPGIVGFENGRWQGTDYLGYLPNSINVDVELARNANVPEISSAGSLNNLVARIFEKENINSQEGASPLPFFHILVLIYPIEKDRFAILGSGRLFEQIQVLRPNFIPQGIWQGITWETEDTAMATGTQELNSQVQALVERIATTFAQRFNQYRESIPQQNWPQQISPSRSQQ